MTGDSGIVTADSGERDRRAGEVVGTPVYDIGTVLRMNHSRASSLTDMAKRNSKQRIDPLIEESAALTELIAPA